MKKEITKDMTSGKPMKLILSFSVPLLLGLLFQQFYSLVDTAIVGKILGKAALAGVGSTGSVSFLIIGLCMGICNGFAIPVAQKFGAKDESALRRYVWNSVYLSIIFAFIITLFVSIFCKQILILMNTPESVFDYAYQYIFVIFLGIPFTFLYNVTAGIIRSLGDSKSPVLFLGLSSVLNIGFDFLFILVVPLNVIGAALATVLSQGISGLICLLYMKKRFSILRASKDEKKFVSSICFNLIGMGLPMGLQYSITAIGTIVIQWAVNNFNNEDIMAGVTAAQRLNGFLFVPFDALGATMATFAGQNTGAKQYARLTKGVVSASILGVAYCIFSIAVQIFFTNKLVLLFTDSTELAVIDYAYHFILYSGIAAPLLVLVNVVRFTIQGMGYSSLAVIAGVMEMIARVIAGIVIAPVFGFDGICLAHPLAWVFADLFLIPAFIFCKKRLIKYHS